MPIALNTGHKVRGFEAQWLEGKKITAPIKEALVDHPFGAGPHSVAFTDDAIRSMATSSTATRDDGAERGFNFCVDPRTVVKKSITPGQRLPEDLQAWPWAVLNAADRCVGDRCSVQINKGCPDTFETRVDHITGEQEKTNILPGIEWGTHHTHPNRKDVRASVGDKLLMIDDAVYQRGPAFSCITALPEVWQAPYDDWQGIGLTDEAKEEQKKIRETYGPDRPTKCFAIPDHKLPSLAEAQWWRLKYNANIRPYYNEWKRLGKAPGREYKDYDSFRKAYDEIDEQTDALIAEVQFSDIKGMAKYGISVTQNMSPGYFGVYEVATSQLPPGKFQMPPPLPKPRVTPITPIKSSFDEIFESLANCEQRTWGKKHWGTKPKTMSEEDFKEIIDTNDLEIRHPDGSGKSIQEICRELSDLGDLWI